MKKVKSTTDELRTEYKRSDFGKLERGKYYERVKASSSVLETFKRIEKSLKQAIAFVQEKNVEVRLNEPSQVVLPPVANIRSPRLAHPKQAVDFKKEVVNDEHDQACSKECSD